MQQQEYSQSRVQHALSDLIVAEMFLMQATLESAGAISSALTELAEQEGSERRPVADVLWDTADQAFNAYASRFQLLRQLRDSESA